MRARWHRACAVTAALLCVVTWSLRASSPKFFHAATQAEFLKGDLDSLSIDSRGQLTIGANSELVYETSAPFLWSMIPAPDNAVWVGTGNEGKVFRIDNEGRGTLVFDAGELEAHALAPAPDGGLYVGTSPDGKVYKVDRRGNATTFFEPEEQYIWAMASDARGELYVATGPKGNVYRVAPNGTGAKLYTAQATNVTAVAIEPGGAHIIIGTDSPGRVLRVDMQGKAFLLLDTSFEEVRSLRYGEKGVLYVAAVNGRTGSAPPPRADAGSATSSAPSPSEPSGGGGTPVVSVSTEITGVVVDTGASSGTSAPDRRTLKGGVFRIAPDGLWDKLWESRDDSPYDVAFDAENRLVIATGNRGKLYRLDGEQLDPTLIATAGGQQVTSLWRDTRSRMYYATANPGRVYRLSADRAPRGTYTSDPRDAGMVSSWGAISWRGSLPSGGSIDVSTRSGNSATPNDTWSEWSAPYTQSGSPIVSPKARYLQWRAVLSGANSPTLTSVTVAHLQRNLRPQVQSITVHPPGIVFQKPYSTGDPDLAGFDNQSTPERRLTNAAMNAGSGSSSPALGRKTYAKGLQTLVWRAADDNEDELTFEVRYRREGEPTWKVLRQGLTEPILVWDTTAVPNGTYIVRVVASDAASNAGDAALTGEMDSTVFEIDNAPPTITAQAPQVSNGRTTVAVEVRDEHSTILKVEYSLDGVVWRPAFATDGMADSRTERFTVTVPGEVGPRGLSIRAQDALNNVATAHVDAPARR